MGDVAGAPTPELGIELIEPPSEAAWATLEAGPWRWAKLRKGIALDWGRLYYALARNGEPGVIFRSDTEIPDGYELRQTINLMLPRARAAGFGRILVVTANEPNNADGWDLARWQREGPDLIDQWLAVQRDFPDLPFISPSLGTADPSVIAPWHLPGFRLSPLHGANIYPEKPSIMWEPGHVRDLVGPPVVVMEFNQGENYVGDRAAANIWALEAIIKNYPELPLVVFFCAPVEGRWSKFSVTVEDARAYAEWLRKRGGTMSYREQHPTLHAFWKLAADANAVKFGTGAADNEDLQFALWLAGRGDIPATRPLLKAAIGRNKSGADEAYLIEAALPNP